MTRPVDPDRSDGSAWLAVTALLCLGAVVVGLGDGTAGGPAVDSHWARALDWQPGLGVHEPWRWWTSAAVHWSGAHLAVNLAGAAVVGFVGWRARAARTEALAWLLAWPLTQAGFDLLGAGGVGVEMGHYGGLSGVLHAGVVIIALALLQTRLPTAAMPEPRRDPPTTHLPTVAPSRTTEGPWAMTTLEELELAPPPAGAARTVPPSLNRAQALRHRFVGGALLAGTVAKVLLEVPWNLALRPSPALGIAVAPSAHACGVVAGVVAWGAVATAVALVSHARWRTGR